MMMATSNGGDLFNGWPEDGEPVELGEPDVIRNEDNILWLRAEIERLYGLRDRWTELIEEHEAEIERLECDLAISKGKHTNAIAEIERLQAVVDVKQDAIDAAMQALAALEKV
jgi:uncharacterized small protein (DUF1192 family)